MVLRVRVPRVIDLYRQPARRAGADQVASAIGGGLRRKPLFVLVQHPAWTSVAIRFKERWRVPLLYDLIDLHAEFPGAPDSLTTTEAELLRAADAVTATSEMLAQHASTWTQKIELVKNGVAPEDFPIAALPGESKTPSFGYVGALADWFDAEAAATLVRSSPTWSLHLAGRVESENVERLGRSPNVMLHGEIPYRSVAGLLATWSAFLVPFRDAPLTRVVDPVKLYEALAAGLPVVARRLPAVSGWEEPHVYLVDHPDDYQAQLRRACQEDSPLARRARRQKVREHTWERRVGLLLNLVARLPAESGGSRGRARSIHRETA
jgi:glycosyltransferase involved in cell wall biosynthesis